LQSIMNNGMNAEFTNKRSSAGFIYGTGASNVNHWQQAGLNSFGSNEYSRLTGMKFGSGWNSNLKQSISLNFFDFNASQDLLRSDPAMLQSGYISGPSRRDAIITWQSSMEIAPGQKLSIDLSRSFGSYRNNFSDDSSVSKNNAFGDVFSTNGKSNYAAAIDYDGNILNTDVQLSLRKTGLGYNNPGNVFLRRGETRVGLNLGRRFLRQKLTVRYKTDFRNQHFDPSKKSTYNNFSNYVQLGYRVKRNSRFSISMRSNTYTFNNNFVNGGNTHGSSFSLQGDAGYVFRIDGKKIMNNSSLSRQKFDIPMLTGSQYGSNTWLVTHSSSVLLKKNLLTLTLLVNQSDNKDYYFNTSFVNSEIGYSYAAGNSIRFNSGVGFYSNTGWNKQIGLRQQVGGTMFKRLEIDIDATWKKAIQVTRKELANQVYISSSVHYRF
ncbi:MAG TPA: hypothetical protein VFI06_10185, partial [Chitinophagaceae bacterium]|nr:hypothetical protein [Chitinophagaceae bacterium]